MKKLIVLLLIISFTVLSQAQISKSVNITTSGTLSTTLTTTELSTVTNLTITGTINAIDFVTLRNNMPLLAVLDISAVTISAYSGYQGTAGLTSTQYPANTIPQNAFYDPITYKGKTTLTSVILPSSVTSIGIVAFDNCTELTGNLIIPNKVMTIGEGAFDGCYGLTGSLIIPNSVTSIGNDAFAGCNGLNGSLVISNSVTYIGEFAFAYCSGLTGSLIIPNTVSSIGGDAFVNCSGLTGDLIIPGSVTTIKDFSFQNCTGFSSVTIPNSVTSIGNGAFYSCSGLKGNLLIPNSVTAILFESFWGCTGLTSVTIGNGVTSIGGSAFDGCTNLGSLTIGSGVTTIGSSAFSNLSSISTFIVQNNNQNYSSLDGVLYNKNQTILIQYPVMKLGAYTLPNSVTSIGDFAFYNCTVLSGVTIPNSVVLIGSSSFYGCTGLTSLTIPNSVTSISNYAFNNCNGLTSIYANSSTPIDLSSTINAFYNILPFSCTLYVPVGSLSTYKKAYFWGNFLNIVETSTAAISTLTDVTVKLYPNPISDYFQVSGIEGQATITIRDLNGKTLLTKQVIDNENIPAISLPKGLYIIKITSTNGVLEKKIIKK